MKKLILRCEGVRIGKFTIPPFELYEGELITIYLYNGAHFYDLEMALINLLTGKERNSNIKIIEALTFVEHFKESDLSGYFVQQP